MASLHACSVSERVTLLRRIHDGKPHPPPQVRVESIPRQHRHCLTPACQELPHLPAPGGSPPKPGVLHRILVVVAVVSVAKGLVAALEDGKPQATPQGRLECIVGLDPCGTFAFGMPLPLSCRVNPLPPRLRCVRVIRHEGCSRAQSKGGKSRLPDWKVPADEQPGVQVSCKIGRGITSGASGTVTVTLLTVNVTLLSHCHNNSAPASQGRSSRENWRDGMVNRGSHCRAHQAVPRLKQNEPLTRANVGRRKLTSHNSEQERQREANAESHVRRRCWENAEAVLVATTGTRVLLGGKARRTGGGDSCAPANGLGAGSMSVARDMGAGERRGGAGRGSVKGTVLSRGYLQERNALRASTFASRGRAVNGLQGEAPAPWDAVGSAVPPHPFLAQRERVRLLLSGNLLPLLGSQHLTAGTLRTPLPLRPGIASA